MDEDFKELRNELRQEVGLEYEQIKKIAQQEVTSEQIKRDWRDMKKRRRASSPRPQPFISFPRNLMTPAMAVILLCLSAWVFWPVSFTRNPDGNLGAKVRLPEKLKVNFDTWSVKISGDGAELTGTLTASPTESTAEAAVFYLDLRGKDATGNEAMLTNGVARFVRKIPNAVIKSEKDVREILFSGTLKLKGIGDFPINDESYKP